MKNRTQTFPCLNLAYEALRISGTMPAVLNAANEVAVEMFLKSIRFIDIPALVEKAMGIIVYIQSDFEDILWWIETRDRIKKDEVK